MLRPKITTIAEPHARSSAGISDERAGENHRIYAEELESLLERAAERGAIRALAGNQNRNGHVPDDRLVCAEAAAEFLGYSKDWVYRHWKKIGGRKIGAKGLRFSRYDLERWAASRKWGQSS